MSWISGLMARVRQWFSRAAAEERMQEEIRFHLEMEAERLVREQGLAEAEARRRAVLAFGAVEAHKEELRAGRRIPLLEDLWRDVRLALRRLVREPGFSVAMVATIALGIGISTAVFALAQVAVELRFGFQPGQLPRLREVSLDGAALGLAAGLVLLTGGLVAAVSLRSALVSGPAGPLPGGSGRTTAGPAEQRSRRVLVVAQVALACTLLVGSALMARSYWRLRQVEPGFRPERALTFLLPIPSNPYSDHHATARVHHEVLGRLRALPGVEAAEAATVSAFPLAPVPDYYSDRITVADGAPADSAHAPYALFGFATPGYFRALRIPLLRGRIFQADDGLREAPDVLLSGSLARELFGAEDAVGRRVRLSSTGELAYTVVGVVGDVPSRSIEDGPARVLYLPHLPPAGAGAAPRFTPRDEQYVVRTSLPPTSLVAAIRRVIHEVDPELVMMRTGTLEELVAGSRARPRLTMLLLMVGSAAALFLGVIGIYGVLSYAVRQRTSELGVRIALGARPEAVVRMVLRQGALLALGGVIAGLLAALVLTRFLRSLLYEVSPSDPAAFAAVAALLLVVALAASYVPARRAGRIDPVRALRTE